MPLVGRAGGGLLSGAPLEPTAALGAGLQLVDYGVAVP